MSKLRISVLSSASPVKKHPLFNQCPFRDSLRPTICFDTTNRQKRFICMSFVSYEPSSRRGPAKCNACCSRFGLCKVSCDRPDSGVGRGCWSSTFRPDRPARRSDETRSSDGQLYGSHSCLSERGSRNSRSESARSLRGPSANREAASGGGNRHALVVRQISRLLTSLAPWTGAPCSRTFAYMG
jgi:hypothetical protein